MMKRIVFVSHDATRTGAPILLLSIIKWFKENTALKIGIILIREGELLDQFSKLGDVLVVNKQGRSSGRKVFNAFLNKYGATIRDRAHTSRMSRFLHKFKPDLIYANTAVSTAFLGKFNLIKDYVVLCHMHELEVAINEFAGKEAFMTAIPYVTRFVCVANSLKENLEKNYGVSPEKIDIVPEPIEVIETFTDKNLIRNELQLPDNAFVVIGSGTTDWRKSPDLFIHTAWLTNQTSNVYFVWVGEVKKIMLLKFKHDIERLNLVGKVFFIGKRIKPVEYFGAADVFFLSSREDPYPLVCLEAASQGKPVICFANAGGMPDFVREDAGVVVPYMDVKSAAEKILLLKENEPLKERLGNVARQRVREESDIRVVASKLKNIIDKLHK
jgi:glycosyltransferase involved in cell wall biosynthesis